MIRTPPLCPGQHLPRPSMPKLTIDVAVIDVTCSATDCTRVVPAGDAIHLMQMPIMHLPVGFDVSQRTHEHGATPLCPVHAVEEIERQKLVVRLMLHQLAKGS